MIGLEPWRLFSDLLIWVSDRKNMNLGQTLLI